MSVPATSSTTLSNTATPPSVLCSIRLRQAILFYALTFGLAVFAVLIPGLGALYMFTPAIATLVMLLLVTREGYGATAWRALGITSVGWKMWLPAILIPVMVISSGYTVAWNMGWATSTIGLNEVKWGNTALYFTALLAMNTFVFSLGEELGWRGYLLSRLTPLGAIRAHLIIGVLWALWHYPLIFLTSDYYGADDGSKWLLTLLFTLTVIPLSVIIGELRARSGSVWVASLFHSSHNVIWGLLASFTLATPISTYMAGESGVIPLVLYSLIAMGLVYQRHRNESHTLSSTTITKEA